VTTAQVVDIVQQVGVLALLAADLAVLKGGLVASVGGNVLRIGLVVPINKAEAVEQVSLGLAADL